MKTYKLYLDNSLYHQGELDLNIIQFTKDGCDCKIEILNTCLKVIYTSKDHTTTVYLNDKNCIEVESIEGKLKFDIKILDQSISNSVYYFKYLLNDEYRYFKLIIN